MRRNQKKSGGRTSSESWSLRRDGSGRLLAQKPFLHTFYTHFTQDWHKKAIDILNTLCYTIDRIGRDTEEEKRWSSRRWQKVRWSDE